jgi:hypothetical protein
VIAEHEPGRRAAVSCPRPTAPGIRRIGNDLREPVLLLRPGGGEEGAVESKTLDLIPEDIQSIDSLVPENTAA